MTGLPREQLMVIVNGARTTGLSVGARRFAPGSALDQGERFERVHDFFQIGLLDGVTRDDGVEF